jgi:hypothetical protein
VTRAVTPLATNGLDYLLTIVVYRTEEDPALEAQKALALYLVVVVGRGRVSGMG